MELGGPSHEACAGIVGLSGYLRTLAAAHASARPEAGGDTDVDGSSGGNNAAHATTSGAANGAANGTQVGGTVRETAVGGEAAVEGGSGGAYSGAGKWGGNGSGGNAALRLAPPARAEVEAAFEAMQGQTVLNCKKRASRNQEAQTSTDTVALLDRC